MIIKQKKLIETSVEQVKIWNTVHDYYSELVTYLYKYTYNILGIKWNTYKIEQDVPYIKNAVYSSEISCNRYIKGIADREYNKMKFKKLQYENIQDTSRGL
jgi:hypothetical protein